MEQELPDLIISNELIERIQFSVSSRNAEAKLGECAAHVFAAHYSDDPNKINWQYVSSGVACILRNRELAKNGRKYMWSMSLCLYNASYGVLVWKAKLIPNCEYTAVEDCFHVFALGEVDVLVGLKFSSKDKACELHTTYMKWHQERMRDDGKKGFVSGANSGAEPTRFRKEMISKPCNFQHIQGTQAIDECMDIEKIKADIVAAFFGLGTKVGRSETDSVTPKSKKKKKEPAKQRLQFKEIIVPQSQYCPPATSPMVPVSPELSASASSDVGPASRVVQQQILTPPPSAGQLTPPSSGVSGQFSMENGYQDSGVQDRDRSNQPPQQDGAPVSMLQQQQSSISLGVNSQGYADEPNGYLSARQGPSDVTSKADQRVLPSGTPNYQNPASPDFQEYRDSYAYSITPPRVDMTLEKDFAESIFKPPIMTAN